MRHVSVRELRNATAGVVDSVPSGQTVVSLVRRPRLLADLADARDATLDDAAGT